MKLKRFESIDFDDIDDEEYIPSVPLESGHPISYYEHFVGMEARIIGEYKYQNNGEGYGEIGIADDAKGSSRNIGDENWVFSLTWSNGKGKGYHYRIKDIELKK